jgi:hypothetical protein
VEIQKEPAMLDARECEKASLLVGTWEERRFRSFSTGDTSEVCSTYWPDFVCVVVPNSHTKVFVLQSLL